jgi:uridine phosphorylase
MIQFDSDENALFSPPDLNFVDKISRAIMIFDDEVWEDYVGREKIFTFEVKNSRGRVFNSYKIIEENHEKILLLSPPWGSAASVSEMEMLIASGIDKIVAFGTGGALQKDIAKNTLIIPTAAIREEGTSYHYLPPSDEVEQDEESVRMMEGVFRANSIKFMAGKVWTTDGVYRETAGKLKTMQAKNCLAVDMEMASLLAVARFRKIGFAGFLIIDDNVAAGNDECAIEMPRDLAKILQVAVEIVGGMNCDTFGVTVGRRGVSGR